MRENLERQSKIEALYLKTIHDGFAVERDFLPLFFLAQLQKYAQGISERKRVLSLDELNSDPLFRTLREKFTKKMKIPYEEELLDVAPNVGIVKHYGAQYPDSSAYNPHHDPEIYKGIFVLITISGKAILTIKDDYGVETKIDCVPNTVVTLLANNQGRFPNENLEHFISPLETEIRDMMFLGMEE